MGGVGGGLSGACLNFVRYAFEVSGFESYLVGWIGLSLWMSVGVWQGGVMDWSNPRGFSA